MQAYVTPTVESVLKMLKMFFGDDTSVCEIIPSDLSDRYVATFVSSDNCLVAVCACDAKFVAYSGAAFSMLPVDVANEMATSMNFSEVVTANFHEVMNICSRLLVSEQSEYLRLDKTLSPGDGSRFVEELQACGALSGFEIGIPGYGTGHMAVLITQQSIETLRQTAAR